MRFFSATVGLVLALTAHSHSLRVREVTNLSPEDNAYWTAVFSDLKPEDLQLFIDQGFDKNKDRKLSYEEFLYMVLGDYTIGTSTEAPEKTEVPPDETFDATAAANPETSTEIEPEAATTDPPVDQAQAAAIQAQLEAEKQMALVSGAVPVPTPVQVAGGINPVRTTATPGVVQNVGAIPNTAMFAPTQGVGQLPNIPVLPMVGSAPKGTGKAANANSVAELVAKPNSVPVNNPSGPPKLAYNPDLYVQGGANVRAVLSTLVVPVLREGQTLNGGCGFQLTLQADHNMVIRTPIEVLWSLKSSGAWPFVTRGLVLVLNPATGRLEMRSQDPRQRNMVMWQSENTSPGNRAIFGPDGQLVLINSAMDLVWSTGIPASRLCPFQTMQAGRAS